MLFLFADVATFSSHLILGFKRKNYRKHISTYNFSILLVSWSIWNVVSHPLCRQHVVDVLVTPPEIHVFINVSAIIVSTSSIMTPPSMRHLVGLVLGEFLISFVLSALEVFNFSMDGSWLTAAGMDIVIFNTAILLVGSTIILGTVTVDKDIKSLTQDMENRLGSASLFEDDLERRKRAVLTALCDAVLTMDSDFKIIESDGGADRVFRRSMLNEMLTDYLKSQEKRKMGFIRP
ncbi:unnamed protein product [Prorocentrum cordatum]|uniref:Uncharacterized protein n=1 Tax=Prorocentrum cordatum TaxID=2364126 RepID=A0ABN9PQU5_9DINO|nr:unnamed protein product [Polarella glacialis]